MDLRKYLLLCALDDTRGSQRVHYCCTCRLGSALAVEGDRRGRGRSRPVFRCRATGLRCCIFVRMTVLDKYSTEKGCEMPYRDGCWLCCLLTVLLITFHIICDYLYKKNDCVKYRCKFRYWICSSLGYFQGCQIAQDILVTPRRASDL